jgi:Fe-S-cluster containining protein
MGRKLIDSNEIRSKGVSVGSEEIDHAQAESLLLTLIYESSSDAERYFPCLQYGEILLKTGRWEESREFLIRTAQVALNCKNDLWLALSHERLGDLSAAEENWFGALHHYRYALRKATLASARLEMGPIEAKVDAARRVLNSEVLLWDPSILPLGKEYCSGNMAISFVHRDIFLKEYFAHCLQCNFCHDACCSYGADIDIQNVAKIQQQKAEILPFVRPPEAEWFEAEYAYYEEYAGNQYTRINPQGPRCAFISKDQRGCGLHRYAISKHMDYHEIKPLVCILFPLSFGEGILSLAPELDDSSLICSGSGYSAYQSMRSELQYYFGQELVQELDAIEKKVLAES